MLPAITNEELASTVQFFVYKKKGAPINHCARPGCRILGVADRLDLEFRWPSGPNSRSKGAPLAVSGSRPSDCRRGPRGTRRPWPPPATQRHQPGGTTPQKPSTILIIEPSTSLIIEPSTTLIIEPPTTLPSTARSAYFFYYIKEKGRSAALGRGGNRSSLRPRQDAGDKKIRAARLPSGHCLEPVAEPQWRGNLSFVLRAFVGRGVRELTARV